MNYKSIKELSINNKGYYGIGASAIDANPNFPQYLRITDIDDFGRIPSNLPTSINPSSYPDWEHYILKKGDIVFARTGNSTGRSYYFDGEKENVVFAGFLIKFSLDSTLINPKYVGYYCLSNSYKKQIGSFFTGSTRNNINAEQYANLLIPVVRDSLQQHIVNINREMLCYA